MAQTNPHPRIAVDPDVMAGKPCIAGTRITVEIVLRYLAGGASNAQILEAFPALTDVDIVAAIEYAADAVSGPPVAAE